MRLGQEKARDVLVRELPLGYPTQHWLDRVLDALEGCVAPDPRLARIAALFDDDTAHVGTLRGSIDGARGERVYAESTLRAILGGGPA